MPPPHDGSRQVWRRSVNGTEAIAVTSVAGGVDTYDLAVNGKWIIYTKGNDEDVGEWSKLRARFPKVKYGSRKLTTTGVYKVELDTWRTSRIANYPGAIDSLAISPDGTRLALITARDGSVVTMEGSSKLTILDLTNGKANDLLDQQWRSQLASPFGRLGQPTWSLDSKALAFVVGFDAYPSEIFVATWDGKPDPQIHKVPHHGDASFHGSVSGGAVLQWRGNSRDLYFLGDDHARVRIYSVKGRDGNEHLPMPLTLDDVVVTQFAWDRTGTRAVASYSTPDKMENLYSFDGKEWKQITEINPQVLSWTLPKISTIEWSGQNGRTVGGVLEIPANHEKGTRLPVVVNIHGGPTSAWPYRMAFTYFGSVHYACSGYAFFSPNYRGSKGYGDSFVTDLIGHQNEIDVDDILKGIDKLVELGIADKDRVGITGWSNGGYLTNCLIASHSNRFKAASSGGGITDLTMEWGVGDEPACTMILSGGTPWDAQEIYRKTSPIFQFGGVRTPTLFHVGENDRRCPKVHSEMAFRALKEQLNIDSELLVYPGEGHGLDSFSSRKAKMMWDLAWFDHYIKGVAKSE